MSHQSRRSSRTTVIQPRPIHEVVREAVVLIDKAMRVLTAWGVAIPNDSRLHKAQKILEHAMQTNILVPSHRGDLLGLRALELAFDYAAIADTLPSTPLAAMRRELRNSLIGDIEPPEQSRGPLQLQSQGLMRAAFVSAGLSPLHPTHSPRLGISSPDLVLENGTLRYAIEAKRPQKSGNILARFTEGCAQLAKFGLPGGVLVDVTDCVRGLDLKTVNDEVSRAALSLSEEVFVAGSGHKPGFGHVMLAGAYARVAWSSEDAPDHAMVSVHISARTFIFASAPNTLAAHRASWIRSHFQEGLHRLTLALHGLRKSEEQPDGG